MFFKFDDGDILRNRIKAYPSYSFIITGSTILFQNQSETTATIPAGCVSVFGENIIGKYPYVYKNSELLSLKSVSGDDINSDYNYGDIIQGTYPLTATISQESYDVFGDNYIYNSLRGIIDKKKIHSAEFDTSSLAAKEVSLVNIPKIFYGTEIRPGTVALEANNKGTIVAKAQDLYKDGVLRITSGSSSGETVGLALYEHGILLLTGTQDIAQRWVYYDDYVLDIATPEGHWGFDEGSDLVSGSVITALGSGFSGYCNLEASTVISSSVGPTWGNTCLDFNSGSGDLETFLMSEEDSEFKPSGSYSFSFWANFGNYNPYASADIISYATNPATAAYFRIYRSGTDKISFTHKNFAGVSTTTTTASVSLTDTWHHIVAVFDYDNTEGRIYLDGSIAASNTFGASGFSVISNLIVGYNPNIGDPGFRGKLDELTYFENIALTDADVATLYSISIDSGLTTKWNEFASSKSGSGYMEKIEFQGTTLVNNLTMFAHAKRGELNYSTNPSYLEEYQTVLTSSQKYVENKTTGIHNVVTSSFSDETGSFAKTTYISKIAIYDEDKNLLGIASLATPIRKREKDDFTFKLNLDL